MTTFENRPIAIVGMSCRLPGAHNLNEFWKLILEGGSELGELPPDRMNRELQFHPEKGTKAKSYTTLGGIIPTKPFDQTACPISQELHDLSHPSHLKLLEVASQAFQQGELDPKSLKEKVVGTYIGHTPPTGDIAPVMFARLIEESSHCLHDVQAIDRFDSSTKEEVVDEIVDQVRSGVELDDPRFEMRSYAFHAASLLTEAFELDGPSMSFDAACASGFQALNYAILALQQGKLDAAVVGSASYCQGDTLVLFSAAQSLSTQGSCPYDEQADGLVASEGYAVFILKTLDQAIEDGDNIQAVIRSVGISSDGKGKSLWAPRKEGQTEAVIRANEQLDNPYENIQYIEMHATSTQVGDATEMSALTDVFSERIPQGQKIPIGSVKANVGHTLETAGLAGLLKTILSMHHQTICPQIKVKTLNPKIEWDNIPFFVPQEKLQWRPPAEGVPRRGAVNAFGIGGLNVHVIVDEYLPQPTSSEQNNKNNESAEDDEAIAIIGMGSILPGAFSIDALWETLQSGEDQIVEVPEGRWVTKKMLDQDPNSRWGVSISKGGFIEGYEYDWKKHKVPPKQIHNADPLQFMLLDVADAALKDAGYHDKDYDSTRTGVVVGNIFGSEFSNHLQVGMRLPEFKELLHDSLKKRGMSETEISSIYDEYEKIILEKMPALVDETGSFTASTFASRITKTFNLMGGAVAVDSGDSSAMSALDACSSILLSGKCDIMICAAGQRTMGFANFKTSSECGILAKDHPLGPFNSQSDGGLLGEGAGALILKRLSDAQRDGDNIQGIIRGSGVSWAHELNQSVETATKRALENADIAPEQISFIETGSYGQPEFDKAELTGLANSYASQKLPAPVPLGSAAGQFGNVGAVTGILSIIKAVKELNSTSIPKQVGFEEEMPLLEPFKETLKPVAKSVSIPGRNEDGKLYAGVSCYSLLNRAYHVILEGMTKVVPEKNASLSIPQVTSTPAKSTLTSNLAGWRITRFGAASFEELQSQMSQVQATPDTIFNSSHADFSQNPFTANDRFRIAFVSENSQQLTQCCQLAAKMISNPQSRSLLADKGIFYSELDDNHAKVALLFPGQGSQYTGMLSDLIKHYPPATEAMLQADAVLEELNLPSFAELAWSDGDHLGQDIWLTQLSLMVADTIMFAAINSLGIPVECVTGHSFGELAAHTSAGTWSFREAVIATRKRCDAIESCQGPLGGLLSTSASKNGIQQLIATFAGTIHISHCNSPNQTVVGGDVADLKMFAEVVINAGYQAKILSVPAAFHTPLMEDVKIPFAKSLSELTLSPPRIPLLSSVSNRYVSDPDEIRQLIVSQMTRPIDYVELVERLVQDGINMMIEVGPRSVLTGLNRQILEDHSIQTVSADHPKRNGLQQLLFVRAAVETSGILENAERPLLKWSGQSSSSQASLTETTASVTTASVASHFDVNELPISTNETPEELDGLRILHTSGSAFDRGFQHGRELQAGIRKLLRRHSDLAGTEWGQMYDLSQLVSFAEQFFGSEGLEEIQGIAKGAGVNSESLVAHNLRLYLDSGFGGLFLAETAKNNAENQMIHAVNEDLRYSLALQDCLERVVFVNHTKNSLSYLTFGVPGQVGGLNGINSAGVAITSAVLLDTTSNNQIIPAKLQTVLVKELLESSHHINDAVNFASSKECSGAWNLCISHHPTDSLCYLEHDGKQLKSLPSVPFIIATNHQAGNQAINNDFLNYSQNRLERLKQLIENDVSVSNVQQALRDQYDPQLKEISHTSVNTLRRMDNQISVVMQPAADKLWITPGPLANGHQNMFHELSIAEMFNHQGSETAEITTEVKKLSSINNITPAPVESRMVTNTELLEAFTDPSNSNRNKICNRMVMRVVEQPHFETSSEEAASLAARLSGHVVIIGKNEVADAFCLHLRNNQILVDQLEMTVDFDQAITLFDDIWDRLQPKHLFIMTTFDANSKTSTNYDHWSTRRSAGVFIPFLLCQRWLQKLIETKSIEQSSILATTKLGGDFGFSNHVHAPEGGALTGLIKGIFGELKMMGGQKDYRARAVDFSTEMTTSQIVNALASEVTANDQEIEVAYKSNNRFVTRPMVKAISGQSKPPQFPTNAAFVITGGARGVTARVAGEIGRRYNVKLHLVGSSPLPEISDSYRTFSEAELKEVKTIVMKEALANGEKPLDAWGRFEKGLEIDKTLHGFKEEGLSVTYHACDISNKAAVNVLLNTIRNSGDEIHGVIHGAGYERACRFEKKQRELVDRTIGAKADGAAILMELTLDDPVKYFLAFGSVSGRFGGVGQTDYSMSNDLLAKLIDHYRTERPDCLSAVFHWHAWDDAGMAVRPESQHIRKMMDLKFMPAVEGVQHLIDEMESGVPETEVIITELAFYEKNFLPLIQSESAMETAPQLDISETVNQFPLIESVSDYQPVQRVKSSLHFDPTSDIFLLDHQFKQRPLLPVVISIEALLQSSSLLLEENEKITGIKNIEIINGMRFLNDDSQKMNVISERTFDGITSQLVADFKNSKGKLLLKDKPYLKGTVETSLVPVPLSGTKPVVTHKWYDCHYSDSSPIVHGPIFQCTKQSTYVDETGYALIEGPSCDVLQKNRTGHNWIIQPALIDACLFSASIVMWLIGDGVVAIPHGIEEIQFSRQAKPGEMCLAETTTRSIDDKLGTFDVTLYGEAGDVILKVVGYENIIVGAMATPSTLFPNP